VNAGGAGEIGNGISLARGPCSILWSMTGCFMPNGSPGDGEGIFDEGFELRSVFESDFRDHTKGSMATYPDIKVAKRLWALPAEGESTRWWLGPGTAPG
jgi:hypothetical protein